MSATRICFTPRTLGEFTSCGIAAGCEDETKCCGEIPKPDFTPVMIVVTAVNAYGESSTEHGPVVVCP